MLWMFENVAGGVAQAVEQLPSKSEALSSNPNNTGKKKKENVHLRGEICMQGKIWKEPHESSYIVYFRGWG
jgi:hypothetical protein